MPRTARSGLGRSADHHQLRIDASASEVGLFEHFQYAPGRAARDAVHVHDTVQICFSRNFPGRYRSGRFAAEVPAGAISIVDAWEPHAAEDPVDRPVVAHYHVLYLARDRWDTMAAELGVEPRIGIVVRRLATAARLLRRLCASVAGGDGRMAQEERLGDFLRSTLPRVRSRYPRSGADHPALAQARDFIHAHAASGVSLARAAAEAGLGPQHFAACFRARYGIPPHRFQTLVRLDRARALLAAGVSGTEAAARCGFSDQSHMIRQFKRYLGTVPSRYRRVATQATWRSLGLANTVAQSRESW
jgi:AraC-like DNA-binding protein